MTWKKLLETTKTGMSQFSSKSHSGKALTKLVQGLGDKAVRFSHRTCGRDGQKHECKVEVPGALIGLVIILIMFRFW